MTRRRDEFDDFAEEFFEHEVEDREAGIWDPAPTLARELRRVYGKRLRDQVLPSIFVGAPREVRCERCKAEVAT